MAYSTEQWNRAKFLFELGYSLRAIEEDCGISSGQIGKRSRADEWKKDTTKQSIKSDIVALDNKNDTLSHEKDTLLNRIATLKDYEITILDDVTNVEGIKKFVLSTAALALVRNNKLLTKGTKTVMLKEGQYSAEGQRIGEEYTPYEVPLDAKDLKDCADGIHKGGQSLGVIEQFAPKQDINLTNAQQVNTKYIGMRTMTDEERNEALKNNGRNIIT